jgi:hypothetical protein
MTATKWEYKYMNDIYGKYILDIFSEMLFVSGELESLPDNSFSLLEKLLEYLSKLDAICAGMEALKLKSLYDKQLKNVIVSIGKIKTAITNENKNTAISITKYQLTPFLIELREEIYFWAYVFSWPERRDIYYKTEFANHHINEYQKNPKYEVSIFVPAKDKLEYTKQCVESILRYTDKNSINYELILINHGSKDNTQEYFESIPEAKLIYFEENVRMIMFSTAMRVCEGKYMAFVSNDTVVTKDWLELLMSCLHSDPSAISATPTTPNVSNYQGTHESYTNMQEMDKYAAQFNHHNPLKWESKTRITPVIALYDIDKINKIGFGDRYFQTMEFWDDDFSLRARRAGFSMLM